jgi:hypothetical protein
MHSEAGTSAVVVVVGVYMLDDASSGGGGGGGKSLLIKRAISFAPNVRPAVESVVVHAGGVDLERFQVDAALDGDLRGRKKTFDENG